jgi:hypothetical protein
MAKTFLKVPVPENHNSHGYDLWEVTEDGTMLGWYFTPAGVTGQQYEDALDSAMSKLVALGLTELEVQALLGRQLF